MQVECRIPQLGEGLREVLIVEFLKQVGDVVDKDEPLYEMETDKATTQVESPLAGRLVKWLVQEHDVIPVGAVVALLETDGDAEAAPALPEVSAGESKPQPTVAASPASLTQPAPATRETLRTLRNADLPPRTKRLLKEHGLWEQVQEIPSRTGRLMPGDVLAWLSQRQSAPQDNPSGEAAYIDVDLPRSQQTLNYRLHRSLQGCIPVSMTVHVDWTAIDREYELAAAAAAANKPSRLIFALWCVVRALANHARLRSILTSDGLQLRTYRSVHLGIAVALPDDQLMTAVVRDADRMDWSEFAQAARERIELARQGTDQSSADVTLIVSNIGSLGIREGTPVIVPPAVATMAVGETFLQPVPDEERGFRFSRVSTITLAFDHRVINGMAGANFLNEVRDRIESLKLS